MTTTAQRQQLHALMRYTYARRAQIHYTQARPIGPERLSQKQMRTLLNNGLPLGFDCSGGVTCLCKWAGLHDPNGLHYNGNGYTGTLLAHLPHYSDPRKAKVGALCVFGPGNGDHVAMVMEPGADPLMWSHGSERGPLKVRFSVERSFHRKPATFLSIASL
jgi:hypothetical protein